MINAFPSLEWPAIDVAMREEVPEMARWSEWCHVAAPVLLPNGDEHLANRGAEQGDPDGSLQCGAVIALARRRAREAFRVALAAAAGPGELPPPSLAFDAWYADDGQGIMRPERLELFLQTLDEELKLVGCTRGEVPLAKSSVTLIGHPDALTQLDSSWATAYVQRTCEIMEPNAPTDVLGSLIGPESDVIAHFASCVNRVSELHHALETLSDPAAELTLGRSCGDVSKVNHLLRTSGDILHGAPVAEFDEMQSAFVDRVLGGGLQGHSLRQAAAGVRSGGLGLRNASDSALVAFVSSRTKAAPNVRHLFSGPGRAAC